MYPVSKTWSLTPSPSCLQVRPSSHMQLACVPGHLRPSSPFLLQKLPSSHRRLACVLGHLWPSSLYLLPVQPCSHWRLACVLSHPKCQFLLSPVAVLTLWR